MAGIAAHSFPVVADVYGISPMGVVCPMLSVRGIVDADEADAFSPRYPYHAEIVRTEARRYGCRRRLCARMILAMIQRSEERYHQHDHLRDGERSEKPQNIVALIGFHVFTETAVRLVHTSQ